ncbi:MAG TPA: response regulator transcription factor [Chitinophagaceae bacterium]|jgi:DNA-binding NarL/FixJ family response regulator|nr:response regulator transcription factor [Chitinophagaceae bacterium]
MAIKVFIYDDNHARRDSLKALLELSPEVSFCGEAENCLHVQRDMGSCFPDVVLMDINMPGADGITGLKEIKKNYPHIKVLMQTVFDDTDKVFECIRNGASGYILKKDPPQRILQAIQEVDDGGAVMNPGIALKVLEYFKPQKIDSPLTERETQVLRLLADGLSYKMVADKLYLSFNTVNTHVKHIYEKLHVSSLGEAIAFYYKNLHP